MFVLVIFVMLVRQNTWWKLLKYRMVYFGSVFELDGEVMMAGDWVCGHIILADCTDKDRWLLIHSFAFFFSFLLSPFKPMCGSTHSGHFYSQLNLSKNIFMDKKREVSTVNLHLVKTIIKISHYIALQWTKGNLQNINTLR